MPAFDDPMGRRFVATCSSSVDHRSFCNATLRPVSTRARAQTSVTTQHPQCLLRCISLWLCLALAGCRARPCLGRPGCSNSNCGCKSEHARQSSVSSSAAAEHLLQIPETGNWKPVAEQHTPLAAAAAMKYVLVTGGVVSGLGKGVTASSIGVLLKACGKRVTSIKIGTPSPPLPPAPPPLETNLVHGFRTEGVLAPRETANCTRMHFASLPAMLHLQAASCFQAPHIASAESLFSLMQRLVQPSSVRQRQMLLS